MALDVAMPRCESVLPGHVYINQVAGGGVLASFSSAIRVAMEVDLPADLAPLLHAASEFASYPGTLLLLILFGSDRVSISLDLVSALGAQNDASVKEFLDRFPLHVLLRLVCRLSFL